MAGRSRPRWLLQFVVAAAVALTSLAGSATAPEAGVSALARWTGGIDLYRSGTFTTQKTWLWCTAADVQIARNIARHAADHSKANQQRYFDYMRARNRYDIPVSDGVDPAGWTAGLRHFVDARYRLVASRSFDSALRSAVTNLRRTNLPVAITVAHGNHAWLLTGFTATADPAATTRFTVTSVRVVGPLWGLQSRSYGYDMRPDTKLTPSQLKGFFTPWHYAGVRMAWEGAWVSVQPIAAAATSAPKPTPKPTPRPTPPPTATPTPAPSVTLEASPSASPSTVGTATPSPAASEVIAARAGGEVAASSDPPADTGTPAAARGPLADGVLVAMTAAIGLGLAVLAGLAVRARHTAPAPGRRPGRPGGPR